LPADHGGLIVYKVSEVLAEALLKCLIGFPVWCRVQACGRDLGGEPICFREVQNQGDKVLFDLAFG
jgi:hypothetical protein